MKIGIKSLYISLILLLSIVGCGGKKQIPLSPPEQFEKAQLKFLDEDYPEAIELLEQFTRLHGSTDLGDDAQFLMAESYFKRKEYLLAATEYRYFIQKYPDSEFLEDARYQLGMCYFKQSPKAHLDQTNTELAVKEFNRYMITYGEDGKYGKKVQKHLDTCRNKFAETEYINGYTYYKSMRHMVAARLYFNKVLSDYMGTIWVDDAIFGIAESYRESLDWDNAIEYYNRLLSEYPDSKLTEKAKEKLAECQKKKAQSPSQPKEPETENDTENLDNI